MNHSSIARCMLLIALYGSCQSTSATQAVAQTKRNWFSNWWYKSPVQPEPVKIVTPTKILSEDHLGRDVAIILGVCLFAASIYGYSESMEWRNHKRLGVVKSVKGYLKYLLGIVYRSSQQTYDDLQFERIALQQEEDQFPHNLSETQRIRNLEITRRRTEINRELEMLSQDNTIIREQIQ